MVISVPQTANQMLVHQLEPLLNRPACETKLESVEYFVEADESVGESNEDIGLFDEARRDEENQRDVEDQWTQSGSQNGHDENDFLMLVVVNLNLQVFRLGKVNKINKRKSWKMRIRKTLLPDQSCTNVSEIF